jgi:hypothetical protein
MHRIIAFAMYSARRETEITELKWVDIDDGHENRPARRTVHEMKDPKKKATKRCGLWFRPVLLR